MATTIGHDVKPQHTIESDFLHPRRAPGVDAAVQTCLILLNFTLPKSTAKLWQQSSYTICADGGTNRLYDGLPWMLDIPESEAAAVRAKFLPQAIIGDLDSIRPEVRSFYLGCDVPVLDQSHDQDTTDLVKCLKYLEEKVIKCQAGGSRAQQQDAADGAAAGQGGEAGQHEAASRGAAAAAANAAAAAAAAASTAAGATGATAAEQAAVAAAAAASAASAAASAAAAAAAAAKAAQAAATAATVAASQASASNAASSSTPDCSTVPHRIIVVGALGGRLDHMLSNLNALYQFPHLNITLWGDGNLVRLLKPGTTLIRPARECEGPACGLVPLGGPATCTSSGLRWNLDNTVMQVAGLLSTCNVIDSDEISVTTDRELLWMTEVKDS